MSQISTGWKHLILVSLVGTGIALGLVARFVLGSPLAGPIWGITTVLALVPLSISVVGQLLKGEIGVDIIALLAMAGSLPLEEYLAGAVIALMLTGGQFLEAFADSRARRELSALVERAPKQAHRYQDDKLTTIDVAAVSQGDRLLVKSGEIIPVDGTVSDQLAVVDESAVTGEARTVERKSGGQVLSGTVNAGDPFQMRAIATSDESTYAGIVRLVERAQRDKAPFVRLADRYALIFLPVTLLVALLAWLLSSEPVRALAVLVVATPCPLILAAPVAIVSGISLAARRGIIIKSGGVLETLARCQTLLLDKTGTLTAGRAVVTEIDTFRRMEPEEVLRMAASVDQASPHVHAVAIVKAAHDRDLKLTFPVEVKESSGSGIRGIVEGRDVAVGKAAWIYGGKKLPSEARRLLRKTALEGATHAFVSIDGTPVGALILEDPVRQESPRTIRKLRRSGIQRVVLLTGDHPDLSQIVAAAVGVDEVLAERSPAEKVEAVRMESRRAVTVMVGDGINDAPALAAANVGVAMGARGASASSEAADVVLTVDRLDRLADAIAIARRARTIALQSVVAGMGLSGGGMLLAAAGYLPPVAGALFQEVIDVLVILNALRALGSGRLNRSSDAAGVEAGRQVREEHRQLRPEVRRLRLLADKLEQIPSGDALTELQKAARFLNEELIPHEQSEDSTMYPVVARLIGGEDPTASMSRAHQEIIHLVRLFSRLVEELPAEGPTVEDFPDLRRVMYGLHALLRVHFAQEEEVYLALIEERLEGEDDETAQTEKQTTSSGFQGPKTEN